MFVGKYEVRVDTKHRVIVPQKMREARDKAGSVYSEFYLTLGSEGCVFVYTPEGWESLMDNLGATKPAARQKMVQTGGKWNPKKWGLGGIPPAFLTRFFQIIDASETQVGPARPDVPARFGPP